MLKFFLLKLFSIVFLSALVYEDAEDKSTKRWTLVSPENKGTITNIFDKARKSRVIKLDGNGTKSIYKLAVPLTLENIQMDKSFFTWEMNYSEDFVILIVIDTIKGKRHLIYTPDSENSYLQYGLNQTKKGKWKKYSRNLEKDLQIYEKQNKIIDIRYFVIKGSGLVDNIHLKRIQKEIVRPIVKKIAKKKPQPIVKPKVKVSPINYKNHKVPVLNLKGKNPVVLKVGEEYVEQGAIARNRDGSKINITITNNIDTLVEGEYTVIYIATNKLGNSSIDKRQVVVGTVSQNKVNKIPEKCEELPPLIAIPKKEIEEVEFEEIEQEDIIDKKRPIRPGL